MSEPSTSDATRRLSKSRKSMVPTNSVTDRTEAAKSKNAVKTAKKKEEKENEPLDGSVDAREYVADEVEEPDEVPSQADSQADSGDVQLVSKSSKKKSDLAMVIKMEPYNNNYPAETSSTRARYFLDVDKATLKTQINTSAKYRETADTHCIICNDTEDEKGVSELLDCQGNMNGHLKSRKGLPCRSKFHLSCILKYNASSFQFQYSALPECQNKLQCPLHCCSICNENHLKQSAYIGDLTECVLCLSSYHSVTCLPAGSVETDVTIEIGGRKEKFGMIVCPSHAAPPARPSKHVDSCLHCHRQGSFVRCSTCIRSFHPDCIDTKKIDGVPIDPKRCDFCQCGDVLRVKQPVIVLWERREFWVATTGDWALTPLKARDNKNFLEVGYVVVDWGNNTSTIVPISEVMPLQPQLFHLAKESERDKWEKYYESYDIREILPSVLKRVQKTARTSRYYNRTQVVRRQADCDLCLCVGRKRDCSGDDCIYRGLTLECPPTCIKDGRKCHNRQISDHELSKKIELKEADGKGYGIFATEDLMPGEFIGEYVGELIDFAERERRRQFPRIASDFQANYYMMELQNNKLTIDAARVGNLTRYINHSCSPNCWSHTREIFMKQTSADRALYEERGYIEVAKKILKGQELTFNYQMNAEDDKTACQCGASNCTGSLSKNDGEPKKKSKTVATASRRVKSEPEENPKPTLPVRKVKVEIKEELPEPAARRVKEIKKEVPESATPKPTPRPAVVVPAKIKAEPRATPLFEGPLIITSKRTRRPPIKLQDPEVEVPPQVKRFRPSATPEPVVQAADPSNDVLPASFKTQLRDFLMERAAALPGDPRKKRNVQRAIEENPLGIADEMLSQFTSTQTSYEYE